MKRLFTLFALLFLITFPVFSYAGNLYADVEDSAFFCEQLSLLTELDVFAGFSEDGQSFFHGEKILTRAEAAKLIVSLSDATDTVQGLGSRVLYTDVDASHWAADYIVYLSDQKVIRGMGNGFFAPEEPLLAEQFIKMLVCLLGYDPKAQGLGGYPVGHLAVASETKLLKGCSISQNEPLTRENAAILCYNALDIAMMKQVLWSDPAEFVVTGTHEDYPEETLLTQNFKAKKLRGVITQTYYQAPVNRDDLYVVLTEKNGNTHKFDVKSTGAEDLLGMSVSIYTVKNEETETEDILTVLPAANQQSLRFSLADTNLSFDGKGRVKITVDKETYIAQEDACFYINTDLETAEKAMAVMDQKGQITLLNNDTNDRFYDYILIDVYEETLVVDRKDSKTGRLTFKNGTSRKWEENDDSYYISFLKNGQAISLSEVSEGDVLSVSENADSTNIRVFVSDDSVFGRITSVSDDKVSVDGTSYLTDKTLTLSIGNTGSFYRDVMGEIVFFEKNSAQISDADFGYLFNVSADFNKLSGEAVLYAKLLDNDGFWNELTFSRKTTICFGEDEHTAKDTKELLTNIRTWTGGLIRYVAAEEKCFISEGSVAVVQYELNEAGEIKKLTIPKTTMVTDQYLSGKTILGIEYNKDDKTLANLEVSENTVIFTVKNGETEDIENISVGYAATILEKNTPYFGYGYVAEGGDTEIYNALCLFTEEKTVMGDTPFIVVEETTTIENQDGEFVPAFWGYTDGKADKRLFILTEDSIITEETVTTDGIETTSMDLDVIAPGDTMAALYNEAGEITHLSRLISKDKVVLDGIGFSFVGEDRLKEDIEIHFGYVAEKKKDKAGNNIYILSAHVTDDQESATEIARIREAKLNGDVYLVDVAKDQVKISDAEDFGEVSPLNVDIRDGKTYKDGYGYFIYAKMYEDEIIGAVIYVVDCKDMM